MGERGEQTPPPGLTKKAVCVKMQAKDAAVAQLVEHLTENQRVPSSNLGCGTQIQKFVFAGVAQR